MTRLMQGFPATPDQQITLANWRTAPFNRWAFHHVREIVPSADIPNDPDQVAAFASRPLDLGGVPIEADGGARQSFDEFLQHTDTDGLVIVDRGQIVFERYANGMTAETPHILMSVSKSLLGLLAGIVVARGALRPDRPVTAFP